MKFEEIVGKDVWEQHQKNLEKVQESMKESQKLADQIQSKVAAQFRMQSPSC